MTYSLTFDEIELWIILSATTTLIRRDDLSRRISMTSRQTWHW